MEQDPHSSSSSPPRQQQQQNTVEWFAERGKYLTASVLHHVLAPSSSLGGVTVNERRHRVLHEKVTGEREQFSPDSFVGRAIAHGKAEEPVALRRYCEMHGLRPYDDSAEKTVEGQLEANDVFMLGCVPHAEHDFLGASPDGVRRDGTLIEIKNPFSRAISAMPGDTRVPAEYYAQMQLQAECCALDTVHYFEYRGATHAPNYREEYRLVEVARDREWFAARLPVMRRFWDEVLMYRANPALYQEYLRRRQEVIDARPKRATAADKDRLANAAIPAMTLEESFTMFSSSPNPVNGDHLGEE